MALIGEPGFKRYRGQRLAGAPHQGLGPFDPPLPDVALRADTGRLLERPAEAAVLIRFRREMSPPGIAFGPCRIFRLLVWSYRRILI
jgi:hypothetical protein